jgi:hypothetical protein
VSWSDTTAFLNSLVVGSSPTSSTTQSRATAIGMVEVERSFHLLAQPTHEFNHHVPTRRRSPFRSFPYG